MPATNTGDMANVMDLLLDIHICLDAQQKELEDLRADKWTASVSRAVPELDQP